MPQTGIAATLLGLALAFAGPPAVALATRPYAAGHPTASQMLAVGGIAAIVAAVLWIAFAREGLQPGAIGVIRPSWRGLSVGLLLTVLFVVGVGPLLLRMPAWLGLPGFEAGRQQTTAMPVWLLVLSILVIGSAEEVLYRGYAISRIEALTGSTFAACLISTLCFALAHLPVWGIGPALTTFASGAIFAALFVCQRDLFPLVVAHVATDLAGLLLPRFVASSG